MSDDRGTGLRIFVVNAVALYWAYSLASAYSGEQLESCQLDRGARSSGSNWHGATGPLGMLVTMLTCQLGETVGVLALGGVLHTLNVYLALMLGATALAQLCPGNSTEDMSTREWRSCGLAAMVFGCHPAASVLLGPNISFTRQHGLGVLLGTTLALKSLAYRLEAHWRWDNAYSAAKAVDRLEEGRARRLARYWSGEAETKGWACIACYAGAGLASGFVLPVAGLLYVLERWREFNSHEGDKEAALAMAAKEAESAEKQKKEEAPQAAKKAKQTGGREAARTGRARKPGDAFLAAPRPPSQLRKRRPKPGGGSCMRCVSSCLESALSNGDTLQPLAWMVCFGIVVAWAATSASLPASGHGRSCVPSDGAALTPWPWEMTIGPLATTRAAFGAGAGVAGILWPPGAKGLAERAVTTSMALDYGLLGAFLVPSVAALLVCYSPALAYRVLACGKRPKQGSVSRKMTGWVASALCMVMIPPVFIATVRPVAFLPMKSGTIVLGGCGVSAAQGSWLVAAAAYVAAMTVGVPVCGLAAFASSSRLPHRVRRLIC